MLGMDQLDDIGTHPLNDPSESPGSIPARGRTSHACNPCRARKIKCDGRLPCQRCTKRRKEASCTYRLFSRDKRRDGFGAATVTKPIAPKPFLAARSPFLPSDEAAISPQDSHNSHRVRGPADAISDKKHRELRVGVSAFDSDTHGAQFYGPSSHFSFIQRLYNRIRRQSHQPLFPNTEHRIPEGLRQWGIEQQLFARNGDHQRSQCSVMDEMMLPRELGEAFISAYFKIMHPQAPILVEEEVMATWHGLWTAPQQPRLGHPKWKDKAILYMVLALGALNFDPRDGESVAWWAEYFYNRVGNMIEVFEETTLAGTHLLLLRAIYGMQIGRPNIIYLYLGHAARSATALGLHRAQIVCGNTSLSTRLRATFWTIYYMERIISMFCGRPTCISDDHIDAPYPDDLPEEATSGPNNYAYLRAMAVFGKVSDTIMTANYCPKSIMRVQQLSSVDRMNKYCIETLQELVEGLPPFLHFFDNQSPIGNYWQEVQRSCLGLTYYMTQILIYRPAIVYVTFYDSKALAQNSIGDQIDISEFIRLGITAANELIELAHDAFFKRCAEIKRDGNMAFFIVSACLTLLFEVLDANTTISHASEVFRTVEKGLECLQTIDHIGSSTGRAMSLDVMKLAKDILLSTQAEQGFVPNLADTFAWLNDDWAEGMTPEQGHSWLYNSVLFPEFLPSDGSGTEDIFQSSVSAPNTSFQSSSLNQTVLGLMGEGMRFNDQSMGMQNL